MYCPSCRSEYREGIHGCPECGVLLVDALPPDAGAAAGSGYVPVLETSDVALLPVIESVLEGAGIAFEVQGDEAMGVLPVGVFGTGERMHGVAARILVPADRADEARRLLESMGEPAAEEEADAAGAEE